MSENVDAPPAKSSKGPPKWMLFTGCGCVVPGFLLVATGAFAIQMGQKLFNQNEAYRTLAELIPFDDSAREHRPVRPTTRGHRATSPATRATST